MVGGICTSTFCYNRKLILKPGEFSGKPFYTSLTVTCFLEGCFCCFLAGTEKDRSIDSCCLLTAPALACVASVRTVRFLLSKTLFCCPAQERFNHILSLCSFKFYHILFLLLLVYGKTCF